jgi:hypothetical protein
VVVTTLALLAHSPELVSLLLHDGVLGSERMTLRAFINGKQAALAHEYLTFIALIRNF